MAIVDLTSIPWTLLGWRPYMWKLAKRVDTFVPMPADLGPFPAVVPGSVQRTLFEQRVIEDWHVGFGSRECEWVEHRHWDYNATVQAPATGDGDRIVLNAQGLDYAGWVLVDCVEAAQFQGGLEPHRFDLTAQLGDGKPHLLSIVFDEAPQEQGQIGYTSRSHFFKSRYNYSWDWCPRIVPIGITGALMLRTGADAVDEVTKIRARLEPDLQTGSVEIEVVCGTAAVPSVRFEIMISGAGREVHRHTHAASPGSNRIRTEPFAVKPWWPNGLGDQPLYAVEIAACAGDGAVLWTHAAEIGFRRIEWRPCEGAPANAEPWVCVVNGTPVFLQGANWVPPKASYPDASAGDYEALVALYKDMGCTVLRVWGGAILEAETFYRCCDRAGILVWQEFPLSSSGVENWPPEDPEAIAAIARIAESYIRRRAHHASLLLWCGGNELMGGADGSKTGDVPVDYAHPCIAALRDVVLREDPDRRFLPTSASGPKECANAADFGKGIHHDVHGPWGMGGFEDIEAWRAYWQQDDALFRSEVGMPGACSVESIRRYAGRGEVWPPAGAYWMHTAAWWTLWDRYEKDLGTLDAEEGLRVYVERTQQHQAEAYAIAAKACKDRFPRCGGFIIWMGHDCYPCPVNNSVIDFDQQPKPAYHALRDVFCS